MGGGARAQLGLEAAPGSARPGRSRHVTGAARSRAVRAPATGPPWGTRTRRRAALWSCGSRKVGQGRPGAAGLRDDCLGHREGSCTGWAHSPPMPTANLTGHKEKVSVENFELLKVLGTGGEDPYPPGRCPRHRALGLLPPAGTPAWAWARPPAMPPTLSWNSPPCLPCPARVCMPFARASWICQHLWGLAAFPSDLHSSSPCADIKVLSPTLQTPQLGFAHPSQICTYLCLPCLDLHVLKSV